MIGFLRPSIHKPFDPCVLNALVDRCHELQRKRWAKEKFVESLAEDLEQAREAIANGVRVLLLDNFSASDLVEIVLTLRAEAPG